MKIQIVLSFSMYIISCCLFSMDPPSSEGKFDSVINQINKEDNILGTIERDMPFELAKKNPDTDVQACPPVREVFTYKLCHGCAGKISNTLNEVLEYERTRKPRFRRPESEKQAFEGVIKIEALDENRLQVTATPADYEILTDTIKTLDVNRVKPWKEVFGRSLADSIKKLDINSEEASKEVLAIITVGYHLEKADEYLRRAGEQFPEVKIELPIDDSSSKDDSCPKDIPLQGWFIGK